MVFDLVLLSTVSGYQMSSLSPLVGMRSQQVRCARRAGRCPTNLGSAAVTSAGVPCRMGMLFCLTSLLGRRCVLHAQVILHGKDSWDSVSAKSSRVFGPRSAPGRTRLWHSSVGAAMRGVTLRSRILQTLCHSLQNFPRKFLVRYGAGHADGADHRAIGHDGA